MIIVIIIAGGNLQKKMPIIKTNQAIVGSEIIFWIVFELYIYVLKKIEGINDDTYLKRGVMTLKDLSQIIFLFFIAKCWNAVRNLKLKVEKLILLDDNFILICKSIS